LGVSATLGIPLLLKVLVYVLVKVLGLKYEDGTVALSSTLWDLVRVSV
jgi:hypothetical protein